ncbi:MAG: AbrB/MazE/SpoVT family DNA-binding domain-containing protein [Anaerolineae bacterium]|nr:AbrB/MazE/SpoVT family DNA-binding domain-containing protein [Anaerolineae bacterium]
MFAKIQKWGNSLALRIPKTFADETGLENNSEVEIQVVDGEIHIIPRQETRYELEALLERVTEDNRHGETDMGDIVGNEVW